MDEQPKTNTDPETVYPRLYEGISYVPSPTGDTFFNRPRTRTLIKNICRSDGFRPRYIVHFMVELPFLFPLSTEDLLSMTNNAESICMFSFTVNIRPITIVTSKERAGTIQEGRSMVEMAYISGGPVHRDEDSLSTYFDALIDRLNKFLLSYLIISKDVEIYRLSKEMLNIVTICTIFDFVKRREFDKMIFMIHPDIPLEKKMLQKEDVKRVLDFSYVTRDSTNPFIQQEELYLSAERYFKEGFYRDSVMNVQTMIEEFLRTLHIHLILSEGKSEAEVATIRENMPFISMVKQEFHERIGGSWQINNQNTAVGNWYTKTYSLRNRVSHSGYFPTYYEAREALDAAIELRNYVIALIKRKRKLTP